MGRSSQTSTALIEPLTHRESDILAHLAANRSNQEIARLENLALSTVKWYVNQILGKLGATSRTDAVARAIDLGLILSETHSEHPHTIPRNNLPRQLTSFIGREGEIAQLEGLVGTCALVTVTGAGGVGKTRLALETASRLLPHFSNGVWLVELAPVSNPELVPQTVVSALGFLGRSSLPPTERLCEYLASRQVLLVLDNCEHVIHATADLAHTLLHACPRLCILVTSREILGAEGETIFRCPSLSVPSERPAQSVSYLAQFEAVRLFTERGRAAALDFVLDGENAADVACVCRRLDGIPLAIELAASRLRMLSTHQIAARLDDVFHLLTGGARTDLPRHKTLAAMIDWSYNLLSEAERRLLQRLSIFAGSWNLEAAEAVCTDSPDGLLPMKDILDLLGQLVDKSLVEVVPGPAGMRYRMLETIRQFARERMVQAGEVAQMHERHLDYYLAFSLEAEPNLVGAPLREWRERVDAELDNLHAAMEWSLAGRVEKGLRLLTALHWYYHGRRNLYNEEQSWLERLLAAEATGPEELRKAPARRIARGRALNVAGHLGMNNYEIFTYDREAVEIFSQMGEAYRLDWAIALLWSGDVDLREVLTLFRDIGDRFWITNVLFYLSSAVASEGDLLQAKLYLEESLALCREIGYTEGEGSILLFLGRYVYLLGEQSRGIEMLNTVPNCFSAAGSIGKNHYHMTPLGLISLARGDYKQAEHYIKICLASEQEAGLIGASIGDLGYLVRVALASGQHVLAKHYFDEAIQLGEKLSGGVPPIFYFIQITVAMIEGNYSQAYAYLHRIKPWYLGGAPILIRFYALLATALGQIRHAAILFGSLDTYPWLMDLLSPLERDDYHKALADTRAALSAEEFGAAWAQGQAMKARQALDYARENAPDA